MLPVSQIRKWEEFRFIEHLLGAILATVFFGPWDRSLLIN